MSRIKRSCILGIIFIIISIPRFIDLEHPSFSYDELEDYFGSCEFVRDPKILRPITYEGYRNGQLPWFSAWILYQFLGASETVARLNSVVASLLTLFVVFLIVERIRGFNWAAITVLILGLSPFYVSSSRLAFTHGHSFCTLPIMACLYFLLRFYEQTHSEQKNHSNGLNVIATGLFLGLAVGTDLLSSFWAVSVFVAIFCWSRKRALFDKIDRVMKFSLAGVIGFFVASPMYLARPYEGIKNALAGSSEANAWTGYLWLGNLVDKLPSYYYLVVAITKLTPMILLLVLATVLLFVLKFKSNHSFYRFLFLSVLWSVICISMRPGKSPYYLIPFIPVIYILLVDGFRWVLTVKLFESRLYLRASAMILVLAGQLGTLFWIHPDYLMLGIQYGDKFYGEFQGPAISHAQWIGETFEFISNDTQGKSCHVYIFDDIGLSQIHFYSKKYDLSGMDITFGKPPTFEEEKINTIKGKIYLILNQDAKKLVAPCHRHTIEKNKELVSFAEKSKDYKIVKTFYSGAFPMMWIYKKEI